MVNVGPDSITNIHKRWTITRLNPSSYKISIAISLASTALIVTLSFWYGPNGIESNNYAVSLFYGISAVLALSFLDYLAMHGTPTNKISKIFHVEGFGNLLWSVVLAVGIAIDSLFGYNGNSNKYLLEGMLVVAGFRIAIFRSVFGAGLMRAVGVSFIEPILFMVILLSPWQFFNLIFQHPTSFIVGIFFVICAVIWSIMADRAGRPHVMSTFNLLQAFLSAWTEQKGDKMEAIAEARAKDNHVTSYVIKFECNEVTKQNEFFLIIPGVHPGPFKPVGGSNLPYELFRVFAGKALVVHSASDHSLNIPSRNEMTKYLFSFSTPLVFTEGSTCTEPLQIKRGDFTVTGIAFGSICLVILSSSQGMEDVPATVSSNLQDYASSLGFSKTLVVDSHNAMGGQLSADDEHDLIVCAREILDKIKDFRQYRFGVGFASRYRHIRRNDSNFVEDVYQLYDMEDIGPGGLAVIALEVRNKKYVIGWADSNNMESHVRDAVLSDLKSHGFYMLEVCTSDTHFTSGKRTRHGYYSLGTVTGTQQIADYFRELAAKSFADIRECSFSLLRVQSNIKVMGKGQFEDYSKALDSSMNLTKIFLTISAAVALCMLLLT